MLLKFHQHQQSLEQSWRNLPGDSGLAAGRQSCRRLGAGSHLNAGLAGGYDFGPGFVRPGNVAAERATAGSGKPV